MKEKKGIVEILVKLLLNFKMKSGKGGYYENFS